MGMRLKIAIAGGGIGGLAAATLLAELDHDVHVFERSGSGPPAGAGILIQPTGASVLHQLGIGQRVGSLAAPVTRLLGTNTRGSTVLDLRYADLAPEPGHPEPVGWGVHRAMLHRELAVAAQERSVSIHRETPVTDIQRRDEQRTLISDSTELGAFDLVLIADGARSTLRQHSGRIRHTTPYRWGALWHVSEIPSEPSPDLVRELGSTLRQVYRGTHTMLGFLPSGRVDDHTPPTISLFWSLPLLTKGRSSPIADRVPEPEQFRSLVAQLFPVGSELARSVRTPDDLILAPYFDVRVDQTDERTLAIGDASHSTSPQLGQGANLALLDARSIAQQLAMKPIPEAVFAHARERAPQTGAYRILSRALTPAFQSDRSPLTDTVAIARDVFLPIACRFPLTRTEMLNTLCGLKANLFASQPLDRTEHTPLQRLGDARVQRAHP